MWQSHAERWADRNNPGSAYVHGWQPSYALALYVNLLSRGELRCTRPVLQYMVSHDMFVKLLTIFGLFMSIMEDGHYKVLIPLLSLSLNVKNWRANLPSADAAPG